MWGSIGFITLYLPSIRVWDKFRAIGLDSEGFRNMKDDNRVSKWVFTGLSHKYKSFAYYPNSADIRCNSSLLVSMAYELNRMKSGQSGAAYKAVAAPHRDIAREIYRKNLAPSNSLISYIRRCLLIVRHASTFPPATGFPRKSPRTPSPTHTPTARSLSRLKDHAVEYLDFERQCCEI